MKGLRSRRHRAVFATLKQARLVAGVTQQQLAKRIRRPQSFVSMYETGDRRIDVPEFLEIADALGADACELVAKIQGDS